MTWKGTAKMLVTNKLPSLASTGTVGKKQDKIQFPSDSGQSLTTTHCNRSDSNQKRQWVIRKHIPHDARKEHEDKRTARRVAINQAKREIQKHSVRKYDGYYTEDGIWAMNTVVDLDNDEVIMCEWTQKDTPFFASLMKRYGSYKHGGAIFRSATEALK
jgi:hypothetical protein